MSVCWPTIWATWTDMATGHCNVLLLGPTFLAKTEKGQSGRLGGLNSSVSSILRSKISNASGVNIPFS